MGDINFLESLMKLIGQHGLSIVLASGLVVFIVKQVLNLQNENSKNRLEQNAYRDRREKEDREYRDKKEKEDREYRDKKEKEQKEWNEKKEKEDKEKETIRMEHEKNMALILSKASSTMDTIKSVFDTTQEKHEHMDNKLKDIMLQLESTKQKVISLDKNQDVIKVNQIEIIRAINTVKDELRSLAQLNKEE